MKDHGKESGREPELGGEEPRITMVLAVSSWLL
jgi:hypothetical protein